MLTMQAKLLMFVETWIARVGYALCAAQPAGAAQALGGLAWVDVLLESWCTKCFLDLGRHVAHAGSGEIVHALYDQYVPRAERRDGEETDQALRVQQGRGLAAGET